MNTTICDWPTSELADALAPFMKLWLEKQVDWEDAQYRDRAFHWNDGTIWCLSELHPHWLAGNLPGFTSEFHEDCPWQR